MVSFREHLGGRALRITVALVFAIGLATAVSGEAPSGAPEDRGRVRFSRDIRRLLSDRCFLCHGPDEASRQAELRLDSHEAATEWAIAPGDPEASEVVARITSDDPDVRMPPPESNKPAFTAEEIALLRRWIEQGAEYEKHWAFEPPKRPRPPVAERDRWNRHAIDRFVLAELNAKGWEPSARADRRTLLRRASLDLTGLPPTPQQIREFLSDPSPDAWSRALDRLLASEAYGEQQARQWLDAARYADSDGYQYDFAREQWVWRDWVINAFNANMPFDEFTIQQLAGDLLPGATPQQRLATAFNRNHPITIEGGVIDEEYRVEYVLDRTTTAGSVWLGLTLGCARCHDHKYDPLSQKEFYQLSAFFNQVPERGLRGFDPSERIVSPFRQSEFEAANRRLADTEAELRAALSAGAGFDASVEALLDAQGEGEWKVVVPSRLKPEPGERVKALGAGGVRITGAGADEDLYEVHVAAKRDPVHAIRLIAMPKRADDGGGADRAEIDDLVLTHVEIEASSNEAPKKFKPQQIAYALSSYAAPGFEVSSAISGGAGGWAFHGDPGRPQPPQALTLVLPEPLTPGEQGKIIVRMRLRGAGGFRLATTSSTETRAVFAARGALEKPASQRSYRDLLAIAEIATRGDAAEELGGAKDALAAASARLDALLAAVPKTMVMRDLEEPRGAYVLERGEYDKRRDRVVPGTPAFLPPMPDDLPRNRLGLAKWLTMSEHPLTSRVVVNRFWIQLFGGGLLDTPEDFGLQSELPSHPELLDWLAVEFVESGWDVKRLLKSIMMSETYQQSSAVTAEMHDRDPLNRHLARGPRLRLDAESIRDSALAVSGLLNRKVGGPSVFPYHPKGLWLEINNRPGYSSAYVQDTGERLYRRSLYTFWKRTVTPPSMAVFDAPSREYCVVRRSRTNTPLQAFVMLHDPQFIEAARALAERMLHEGGETLTDRLRFGFEVCVGRPPEEAERRLLAQLYRQRLEHYRSSPEKAEQLLRIGERPRSQRTPLDEHAAMTTVARLLMNLSEFITKG